MISFNKYHACGNDFVIIDNRFDERGQLSYLAKKLCDRHTGIGADNLLVIEASEAAEFKMDIYNADGTGAEMCGNGIRCFAKHVFDKGLTEGKVEFTIETKKGIIGIRVIDDGSKTGSLTESLVEADMGEARFDRHDIPMTGEGTCIGEELEIDGRKFTVTSVNTGIPQTVVIVDELESLDIEHYGRLIENHPNYPEHTNVNFVQVLSKHELMSRAWERGCGATLSCGTGACAAVAACHEMGLTEREAEVKTELGSVIVKYSEDGRLTLSGPVTRICEGNAESDMTLPNPADVDAALERMNALLEKFADEGIVEDGKDFRELMIEVLGQAAPSDGK